MTAELARAGGPIGCAGLALLLVAGDRRLRLLGLAAWALGALFLLLYLAPHGHRALLVAAAVVGLLLAALGAVLLRRWPWLLALCALAAAPARLPVHVGGTKANLLIPLYGVVVAAVLALGWELLRGDRRARELGPLALPLGAFVAWSGLSLAWSDDLRQGAIELLFFYLPFGLLGLALARLPWSRRWLRFLYGQLTLMGAAFAAIGVYQWISHDLFWNRKVIVGNAYQPFFRVNSVFYDPSIYGRFLAVVIVASLVVVLYGASRRVAVLATLAIAACWVGMLFSFSQSSFVALVVGVLAVALLRLRPQVQGALALAGASVLLFGLGAPSALAATDATGGRLRLVTRGLELAAHNPVGGVGVGAFQRAYGERYGLPGRLPKAAASHTTPVTVVAETGIPGILLFAWLLVAALLVPLRRVRATLDGRALLVFAAGAGVIFVHSLFYNALFEDPLFWCLLALVPLGLRAVGTAPAPAAAPAAVSR